MDTLFSRSDGVQELHSSDPKDRPTNFLSQPSFFSNKHMEIKQCYTSGFMRLPCAVYPSGQYLYLSYRKSLYQLDLLTSNISASQTTVAEWDGFADPFPTIFIQSQLGPDCKIYILAGGDTRYYHVIHNPGVPCTATVSSPPGTLKSIQVYPNPTVDQITFVFGYETRQKNHLVEYVWANRKTSCRDRSG
jgi:hypothetical protein